jgi:hypothetical protein
MITHLHFAIRTARAGGFVATLLCSGALAFAQTIPASPVKPLKTTKATPAAPTSSAGKKNPSVVVPEGERQEKDMPSARPAAPAAGTYSQHPVGNEARPPNGSEVSRTARGGVRSVRVHGTNIVYGPGGSRTISRVRPDRSLVVLSRQGFGYVQHPYDFRGTQFVQRTYLAEGRLHVGVYRQYLLGNVPVMVYAPAFYYPAPYYQWAYYSWGPSVVYTWNWMAAPWFQPYRGYFSPYTTYGAASPWLTDYVISQTLQSISDTPLPYTEPLSFAVKEQVRAEVTREIMVEYTELLAGPQAVPDPAAGGVELMLRDQARHVFLVSTPLYAQSSAGECWLTAGDVLGLGGGLQSNISAPSLEVLAASANSCTRNSFVAVGVADLQEMQNRFREILDQGLAELRRMQGTHGLPASPASSLTPLIQPLYTATAPPPDPNIGSELNALAADAELVEAGVTRPPPNGISATTSDSAGKLALKSQLLPGQTLSDVIAIMGSPQQSFESGKDTLYVFPNTVVTISSGRVTRIQ